jgi:1-pyrroline-5-carboxylate dehydrogenase
MRGAVREHPIPVIAEMGSKNPVIVTLDADMEKAVDGVMTSTYGFGGQKCSACSRLYVQQRVKDDFEALLKERAERLIVGDPRVKENYYGPLIERKKAQEYLEHCAMGARDGMLLTGGQQLVKGKLKNGHYVEPAIITGIPNDHYLMQNELFMPILCTQPFDRLEEAVEMANRSAFGLTAGLFSEDAEEINYFFDHIHSGVTYANRRRGACTGAIVGTQAFVGWKASGSTGKGTGGAWYLQQFLREQTRTVAFD